MPPPHHTNPPSPPTSGLAADATDLIRVAVRDRWGLAFIAVGWSHLFWFLVCHVLFAQGDRSQPRFLLLWGLDLGLAVAIGRRAVVRPAPSLLGVLVRVWATYFILCFSAASLNSLMGFSTDWFKAVWATLATFGFAMMAWLVHPGFLLAAVQMSLTGLLIARFPSGAYGIFGVSWCLALNGFGVVIERARVRAGVGRAERVATPSQGPFQASR